MTRPNVREIEGQLRDLVVAEFDRRIVEASRRLPAMCHHHVDHPLDARMVVEGEPNPNYNRITSGPSLPVIQTMGLCGLTLGRQGENDEITICDEPGTAQRCPYFTAKYDRRVIDEMFQRDFSDVEWVRLKHPEIHSLLWVLGLQSAPRVSWWRRLLARIWPRRERQHPQLPKPFLPFDPLKLLEAPKE